MNWELPKDVDKKKVTRFRKQFREKKSKFIAFQDWVGLFHSNASRRSTVNSN